MKKKLAMKNVAAVLLGTFLIVIFAWAFANPASATTRAEFEAYARHEAKVNGVNADHLVETLRCEAHFKSKSIGDSGSSYGLAQIHLPSHPDITPKQALNGYWAIDWTIKQFYNGNADMWSCWRKLYG